MAPRRLLLEGPALEPLLQRARAEHGPGTRIVKAERVRVGGLAGFFAREQYEVTVEVETAVEAVVGAAARSGESQQLPRREAAAPSLATAPAGHRAQGIEALMAAAEVAERTPAASASRSDFDSIFTSMISAEAPAWSAPPAQPVQLAQPAPPAPPAQLVLPASPARPVLPVAEIVLPAAAPGPAPLTSSLQTQPLPVLQPQPQPQPQPPLPTPPALARPAARPALDADAALPERLAELGVPREWLWDLPSGRAAALRALAGRIAAAQAQSPRPPLPRQAPVLVVMAELGAAVPVARHLAAGLGVDASEVAVLQRRGHGPSRERLLAGGQDLLAQAHRARLGGRPLVAALPAPIVADPASRAAVADVVAALEPDDVWAVVDATRRLPDTSTWLSCLGVGRGVDAVALTHLDATSAPAAALALAVPVVLLGERPASPRAWVQMLAARLPQPGAR